MNKPLFIYLRISEVHCAAPAKFLFHLLYPSLFQVHSLSFFFLLLVLGRLNSVHPLETENQLLDTHAPIKLKKFVELTMDIASGCPKRYFFEVMRMFATAEHEKKSFQYFVSPERRDDLYQSNQRERRIVLEISEDSPSVEMPFEWLVHLVPPLKTRAFSIASSPSVHPNQVHLTMSVVLWTTPFKRNRAGLCSSWLAKLDPEQCMTLILTYKADSR